MQRALHDKAHQDCYITERIDKTALYLRADINATRQDDQNRETKRKSTERLRLIRGVLELEENAM